MMLFSKIAFAQVNAPEYIYYVQVGAYKTENEALGQKTKFQSLGYNPIKIYCFNNWYKVLVGEFDNYVDAYIWRTEIRKKDCSDAFIFKIENIEQKSEFSKNTSPIPNIFNFVKPLTEDIIQIDLNTTEIKQIEQLYNDSRYKEAEDKINEYVLNLSNDVPLKGWYIWKLAWIKYKRGQLDESFELFKKIAQGNVCAPKNIRIQSLFSAAKVLYAKNDKLQAYRAFSEINFFLKTQKINVKPSLS